MIVIPDVEVRARASDTLCLHRLDGAGNGMPLGSEDLNILCRSIYTNIGSSHFLHIESDTLCLHRLDDAGNGMPLDSECLNILCRSICNSSLT